MSLFGIDDPSGDQTPVKSRGSVLGEELGGLDWPAADIAPARTRKLQPKMNENLRTSPRVMGL